MYVRCTKCGWGQDDFWDKDYNPIECIGESRGELEEALGKPVSDRNINKVDVKTWLHILLDKIARRVENMKWQTLEDFKSDPDPVCPRCNCNKFSLD